MSGPLPADDATVLAFADRLYERAEEEDGWEDSLQEVGDTLQATSMAIHRYDTRSRHGSAKMIRGPSFNAIQPTYEEHAGNNVWMKAFWSGPLPRPGGVISSHRLYPEAALLNHVFYHEFLKPRGLFSSVGAVLDVGDGNLTSITILRDRRPGLYREDEERFLGRVCPHLRNVYRVDLRFAEARALRALLAEVLERLPTAVFALESDLRIVVANRAAEHVLSVGDGIRRARGCLELSDQAAARSLRSAVAGLARASRGDGASAGASFPIGRPSFSRPYSASAVPVRPLVPRNTACSACCLLLIDDPERQELPSERRLMQLWKLTVAEARVASLLAAGHSPREIADQLQVSFNTVRTQLQRIYMKTDTSRQGDLIRLLTRLVVTFADDAGDHDDSS